MIREELFATEWSIAEVDTCHGRPIYRPEGQERAGDYEGDVVEMIGAYGVPFRREAKYVNGYYIPLVKFEYGYNAIDTIILGI
jgi:hypothetical protein